MKRVCQVCGKTFEGEHYALKCRIAYKPSAYHSSPRVSADHAERHFIRRAEGVVLSSCRAERQRFQQRKRRAQGGALRPLGSS